MSNGAHLNKNRRSFLIDALRLSGQVALASSAVYTVGHFIKENVPSASMLAGAKTCGWMTNFAGNESSCSYTPTDPLPAEPCSDGNSWAGCTVSGTPGIYETKVCVCY